MWNFLKRVTQTQWIIVAVVLGIAVGWLYPETAQQLAPASHIFLRLIKSLVVPLIFSTLVIGIAGHGDDMKQVGRLALRSIIYFEIATTLALAIGLVAVNVAKPGVGINLAAADTSKIANLSRTPMTFGQILEHAVPQSFAEAWVNNEVLQIVVFSIIFAVALARVKGKPKETVLSWCEGISEVMFKYVAIVMAFAPIGIGAAIAVTVGASGPKVLLNLIKLVATLYVALIAFVFLVLLPIALIMKVPLQRFLRAVKEPWLIAFTTASSEAALPRAMQAMEAIGVPRRIVAFVMPTGYSFNLDGTNIYMTLATLFIAQALGFDLTFGQQITILLVAMLTSKGASGITGAGFITLAATLAVVDPRLVPGMAIVLGIDKFMSECRALTNLCGNGVACVVVSWWEGELDKDKLHANLNKQVDPSDMETAITTG